MEIVKQIVKALHSAFPDCEIYTESIPQGFCPPCFSVRQLGSARAPYPGKRYRMEQSFDVRYFPKERRALEACRQTADRLYSVLACLPDNTARGTGLHWEITDSVLHFFVQYNYFVWDTDETETMQELKEVFR